MDNMFEMLSSADIWYQYIKFLNFDQHKFLNVHLQNWSDTYWYYDSECPIPDVSFSMFPEL